MLDLGVTAEQREVLSNDYTDFFLPRFSIRFLLLSLFFFLFIFLHALIYTYTDNVERELTILRTMETARDAHDDRSYCSKV